MTLGTTYYISAIAGMDDGNGNVDLTDPELSVAVGTPVTFFAPTTSTFEETICQGDIFTTNGIDYSTSGTYLIFTLQNSIGCDSLVYLDLEVLNPVAGVLPPPSIDCGPNQMVTLEAVITNPSPTVSYEWSGNASCIVGPTNNTTLQVTCGGTYTLIVAEIQNGVTCTSNPFTVNVMEDTAIPIADPGVSQTITCNTSVVTLGGPGTSVGPN